MEASDTCVLLNFQDFYFFPCWPRTYSVLVHLPIKLRGENSALVSASSLLNLFMPADIIPKYVLPVVGSGADFHGTPRVLPFFRPARAWISWVQCLSSYAMIALPLAVWAWGPSCFILFSPYPLPWVMISLILPPLSSALVPGWVGSDFHVHSLVANFLSVKRYTVSILGFTGPMIPVAVTQFCCSWKVTMDKV